MTLSEALAALLEKHTPRSFRGRLIACKCGWTQLDWMDKGSEAPPTFAAHVASTLAPELERALDETTRLTLIDSRRVREAFTRALQRRGESRD